MSATYSVSSIFIPDTRNDDKRHASQSTHHSSQSAAYDPRITYNNLYTAS